MAKVTRRTTSAAGYPTRRTRLAGLSSAKPAKSKAASPGGAKRKAENPRPAGSLTALRRRLAQAKRYIARLEAHADRDFLLDIPNRRGFERELNRSIAYVKRYRASAALLVIDVDRLKPINDRFGHAAGDRLLKSIVATLSAHVRQSDMLGRLGGDEFGILLWNIDEAGALAKAAALERAVASAVCEYRGQQLSASVSIGVAMLGDDAPAIVLERADRAMYVRKNERRSGRAVRR